MGGQLRTPFAAWMATSPCAERDLPAPVAAPSARARSTHGRVVCPYHLWEFDCLTGEYDYDSTEARRHLRVKVDGDDILIAGALTCPNFPKSKPSPAPSRPLVGRRIVTAEFRCLRILRGGDPDDMAARLPGRQDRGGEALRQVHPACRSTAAATW